MSLLTNFNRKLRGLHPWGRIKHEISFKVSRYLMATEKTKAIILRVTEFSETSCIASVFTRDFGKQTLIAKGARRAKSPFEAALDVLAICRIVFVHKTSPAMGILTEAKLERRFRNSRKSLDWLYAAYHVIELLRTLMEEGDPHPELFDLAESTIERLDPKATTVLSKPGATSTETTGDASIAQALLENDELNVCLLRFEMGLLKILGHFPLVSHCVSCGRERTTNNSVWFGLSSGGILCPNCRSTQTNLIQVSPAAITELNMLSSKVDSQIAETEKMNSQIAWRDGAPPPSSMVRELQDHDWISLNGQERNAQIETRQLMNRYMANLMGFEPRAMQFLERLGKPRNLKS
jgi:DNA repair protein RecO (recombination protein O)